MMFEQHGILHIYPSELVWKDMIVEFIYLKALGAVQEKGHFSICLAGGSTPKIIYQRLSQYPYDAHFPWKNTFVFWGDERSVPSDDANSNYKMAMDALLTKVPIPTKNIFPIRNAQNPKWAAVAYQKEVEHFFSDNHICFDLTLLGLGDDGHTASLFPQTSILKETNKYVAVVYVEKLKTHRISLTAKAINHSKTIAFLVKGVKKQNAVKEILIGNGSSSDFPAKSIRPRLGQLHWMLDQDAAQDLLAE
jgi:6-phosphogluconolactonase